MPKASRLVLIWNEFVDFNQLLHDVILPRRMQSLTLGWRETR